MSFSVSGNQFIAPGGFGRNTARNVQYLSNTAPEALMGSDIVMTPNGNSRNLKDYFGYAEEDIRFFDGKTGGQPDGVLDINELTQAFGGNRQMADAFLRVIDTNGDQRIDAPEQTSYLLYQDDSINQSFQTAQGLAAMNVLSPAQYQSIVGNITGITGNQTSQPDGTLSAPERHFAEFSVLTMPTLTQQALRKFTQFLNLPQAYQAFQQETSPRQALNLVG